MRMMLMPFTSKDIQFFPLPHIRGMASVVRLLLESHANPNGVGARLDQNSDLAVVHLVFDPIWSAFDDCRLNTNDLSIALDMICATVEARADLNVIDRGLARNFACADDSMCLRACAHGCTFA